MSGYLGYRARLPGEVSERVRQDRLASGKSQLDERPAMDGRAGCVTGMYACRSVKYEANIGEVSERSKEHAWKVCIPNGIEGSNPSLSARQSRANPRCLAKDPTKPAVCGLP